jgi:hypothetical protein
MASGAKKSTLVTTSFGAPSISVGEMKSIRKGGDQPLENNIPITLTCRGGSLLNIGNIKEVKGDKDK